MRKRFSIATWFIALMTMFLVCGSAQAQEDLNKALHDAAWQGNAVSINTFLQRGANVNAVDNDGYTPLMTAVFSQDTVPLWDGCCGSVTLQAYPSMNVKNKSGETALMIAAGYKGSSVSCKAIRPVQLLLDAGADVNLRDNRGETALQHAITNAHGEAIEALLAKRADTKGLSPEDLKDMTLFLEEARFRRSALQKSEGQKQNK